VHVWIKALLARGWELPVGYLPVVQYSDCLRQLLITQNDPQALLSACIVFPHPAILLSEIWALPAGGAGRNGGNSLHNASHADNIVA
jgi:hypothetical protein